MLYLVEGHDRVEVAVAVADVARPLRADGQLRARAHARKQPRLQQPRAVALDVLQRHTLLFSAFPEVSHSTSNTRSLLE